VRDPPSATLVNSVVLGWLGTPCCGGVNMAVTQSRDEAMALVSQLVASSQLIRAVASGRRGGVPQWRKIVLRPVLLRDDLMLQVVRYTETQAFTTNYGPERAQVIDELLSEPFGHWLVETAEENINIRMTKRGVSLHRSPREQAEVPDLAHDRVKARLIEDTHELWLVLGIADTAGRIKPSRRDKHRQVEEFLRHLMSTLDDAQRGSQLRKPTVTDPWRVLDLGCGNGYLTLAAAVALSQRWPVEILGIDQREQARIHNTAAAKQLSLAATFVQGDIGGQLPPKFGKPDVILGLHICDTATDDALAVGIKTSTPVILAAPCCHHDVAAQLKRLPGSSALTRDGIVRERFADTLTDALRACLLRSVGYRVDVVEFVASQHTPRNTLIRAVYAGKSDALARQEYEALTTEWQVVPKLQLLL
jgi:SAM-dependent methyltransferase